MAPSSVSLKPRGSSTAVKLWVDPPNQARRVPSLCSRTYNAGDSRGDADPFVDRKVGLGGQGSAHTSKGV